MNKAVLSDETKHPARCPWCGDDPLYVAYHDDEWGKPCHDERKLFEMLILEGAQAGLSWITILRKRASYREAFAGFDAARVAEFGAEDIARLLANPGIVRNRLKINAAIANARGVLALRATYGSFDRYLWDFVGGTPIVGQWHALSEVPAETELSRQLSRDLHRRGFRFVGPTIMYAFMQAVGMVNDHLIDCPFRSR